MAQPRNKSFEIPFQNEVVTAARFLSQPWADFFLILYDLISHISFETSFDFENAATLQAVQGLKLDPKKSQIWHIDYVIQRITGSFELLESGVYCAAYKSKAGSWHIFKMTTSGPDNSNVSWVITPDGQIYISPGSAMTGTNYIQKLTTRTRSINAKLQKPSGGWA